MLAAGASWLDADPQTRLGHVAPLVATVRMAPGEAAAKVRGRQHAWSRSSSQTTFECQCCMSILTPAALTLPA